MNKSKARLNLTALAVVLSVALQGCASLAGIAQTKPLFCDVAMPIYTNPGDTLTDVTAAQIESHDLKGASACGW